MKLALPTLKLKKNQERLLQQHTPAPRKLDLVISLKSAILCKLVPFPSFIHVMLFARQKGSKQFVFIMRSFRAITFVALGCFKKNLHEVCTLLVILNIL